MPPAKNIAAEVVAASNEIAHRLLTLVEDVDGGELAGAEQAHELRRVSAVGLDPLPGTSGGSAGAMTAQATPSTRRRHRIGPIASRPSPSSSGCTDDSPRRARTASTIVLAAETVSREIRCHSRATCLRIRQRAWLFWKGLHPACLSPIEVSQVTVSSAEAAEKRGENATVTKHGF